MAKNIVNIQNENALRFIKAVGNINNSDVSTIEKQINLSLEIVEKFIKLADNDTFEKITGLKKEL